MFRMRRTSADSSADEDSGPVANGREVANNMERETMEEYAANRHEVNHEAKEAAGDEDLQEDSGRPGRFLERRTLSSVSNFDTESLARMSMSHKEQFQGQGTGVTVTRTLSLDRAEWDRLLAKPTPALRPMHSAWKLDTESLESSEHHTGPVKFRSIFGLPVMSPVSNFSLSWHFMMMLVDLTYTAFVVPIGVGFDISDTTWTWGAVVDFLAGVLFFTDLVLGFHTGYVVTNNFSKRIVMDGKLVARWYVTRGSFIVDLLSSIAWVTQVILIIFKLAGSDQEKLASQIQILRILRIVRLARLFKAAFLSAAGQGLLPRMPGFHGLSYTHSYFLQLLFSIAVMINFLGCLWFWTADTEGISDTWITEFGPFLRNYGQDDLLTKQLVEEFISKPELYLASIYWAFTTVATVGYGDITPQTPGEEAVAIFVFLLGIIFFGVLIGSLTQLLQRASKDARKAQLYREKMESVEGWLRGRRFPARLRRRIREYYAQFWVRQAEEAHEGELLEELPHALRTEALWSMSRKSLMALPMFASLPTPLQFLLASQVQPCKVPPGHDVTIQGGTASKMYLLDYGRVVPIYNDVEGGQVPDNFVLNSSSLLQELHPSFHRNIRGYRTIAACGLWEWNVAAVLGICKHHSGLYEHLASHVIDALLHYTQAEPESWPPKAFELVLGVQQKLAARAKELQGKIMFARHSSFSPEEAAPTSSGGDVEGEDGESNEVLEREEGLDSVRSLPGTQLKRRSAVSFSEDTKNPEEPLGRQQQPGFFGLQLAAQGLQLAAEGMPQVPSTPFAPGLLSQNRRQRETRIRVGRRRGSDAGDSEGDDVLDDVEQQAQLEDDPPSTQALADMLTTIQDQLAELRNIVKSQT